MKKQLIIALQIVFLAGWHFAECRASSRPSEIPRLKNPTHGRRSVLLRLADSCENNNPQAAAAAAAVGVDGDETALMSLAQIVVHRGTVRKVYENVFRLTCDPKHSLRRLRPGVREIFVDCGAEGRFRSLPKCVRNMKNQRKTKKSQVWIMYRGIKTCPTEYFTKLVPRNMLIWEFCALQKCRSADFASLK